MKIFTFILFFTFGIPLFAQQSDFSKVDFSKADQIARMLEGEELTNLPVLVHKLTARFQSDEERFRAIYYWVTHNIKGDYNLTEQSNKKRRAFKNDPEYLEKWNQSFRRQVFAKLIKDKETLCTGYAYLIQKMALLAGLECTIINGYDPSQNVIPSENGTANHSWNAVKLNAKWYLCDATWSAGYTDMSTYLFEYDYDDQYFLMEPSEFLKTHKPVAENGFQSFSKQSKPYSID